jgi:hypothetical protein
MADLSSVVDACTRLVADSTIIGRALLIASKTSRQHASEVGLDLQVDDQDVWDCYADDFSQSDLFTRRIIGITNLVTQARGWSGFWGDIWTGLSSKVWRALGY